MANIYTKRIEEAECHEIEFDFRSNAFGRVVKCMRSAENVVEEAVSKVRFNAFFNTKLISIQVPLSIEDQEIQTSEVLLL